MIKEQGFVIDDSPIFSEEENKKIQELIDEGKEAEAEELISSIIDKKYGGV